ncbi:MAG TPA: histidine phosphatase family protein [Rhizomicrobium sp.]
MGRIYLLRHGQAHLFSDDYDRLSDLGRHQAERAGAALAAQGVTPVLVLSGALRRQIDTARHASHAANWRAKPKIDPEFDEYRHEDLFAPTYPHLAAQAAISAYVSAQPHPRRAYQDLFERAFTGWLAGATREGGLSWSDFRARVVKALQRTASQCGAGESAVIFTSGGVIAAIAQALIGLPDSQTLKLHNPLYNASITRLMTRGDAIALSGFNDISHLTNSGDDALVTYR